MLDNRLRLSLNDLEVQGHGFAYQVYVNNDLSKPVTTHYLPKEKESAVAKPHHMIAPGSSRYSSNDMVHNHYLEEVKQKTQESSRNSEPSMIPFARSLSIANAEHSRNSRNFTDSKHFVCSTCQKCVINENHDNCVTKFLNEVNSRAKVRYHKTATRNKSIEQTSFAQKPERQIPKGHRFSIKKTFVVHEKTMTPRSCLRWKPTGRIFKIVGLRWVPTGKIFASSTNKGFKEFYFDEQGMTSNHNSSELGFHDHSNEPSSSKLVPKVVPQQTRQLHHEKS
ncbi:hypothetical protein Tco_0699598 [Tanacetum coccineum]